MDQPKPHPALKFLFPVIGILGIITVFWLSSLNETADSDNPAHDAVSATEEITTAGNLPEQSMKYIEDLPDIHGSIEGYAVQSCKMCHSSQYDDWSESTHAAAMVKTGFTTALEYTFLER